MKIGDKVVITKDFVFNKKQYKVGDIFTIISDSGMRGWDIQDKDGNIIYETMMISDHYIPIPLKELRKEKLNEIERRR